MYMKEYQNFLYIEFGSPIYLLKGPGIVKAAVPYLIHDFPSMFFVFAVGITHDAQCCSPLDTFLMSLADFEAKTTSSKFLHESTFTTETGCSNL